MSWFEVETRPDAIYRIREPALGDLDCCNCWLVLGAERALLINSGVGVSPLAPVVAAITSLPTTLILTHTHYDHIGGAHEFAERLAHPAEAEALANPTPEATLHEGWLTPESFAYAPYPGFDVRDYAVRPAPATRLVEDGEVLDLGGRRLEVVHAPGHSPGLLCLFDRACGACFRATRSMTGRCSSTCRGRTPKRLRVRSSACASWRLASSIPAITPASTPLGCERSLRKPASKPQWRRERRTKYRRSPEMSAGPHHVHDKWKHDGVKVIRGDQLDPNTAQTPGMFRQSAIDKARVGAQKIWAGTVSIAANAKTGVHHHGELESVIYVVKGKARMRWGERLEYVAEAGPGDFIFVPPFVPHQEINADPGETLECVLVRSDNEAVVVNIPDVDPVEKPEAVYWVDPIHKAGG